MLKQQLLVKKNKKKQIKTIECYEPIHKHKSYFNLSFTLISKVSIKSPIH